MNISCPSCAAQAPEEAIVCPSCAADLRTVATPGHSRGARRDPAPARQGTPGSYMACGLVVLVLAVLIGVNLEGDNPLALAGALILGAVAQILLLIGVIAKGVEIGNRT